LALPATPVKYFREIVSKYFCNFVLYHQSGFSTVPNLPTKEMILTPEVAVQKTGHSTSSSGDEIKPLTGIRGVAANWVILLHFQGPFIVLSPSLGHSSR
jgi:hypothetical protein